MRCNVRTLTHPFLILGLIVTLLSAGLVLSVHPLSHINESVVSVADDAHEPFAETLDQQCDLCWLSELLLGLPFVLAVLMLAVFGRAILTPRHVCHPSFQTASWAHVRAPPLLFT